jgi:hypothetical protein
MDQCIVAQHSRGRLSRHGNALSGFLDKISPSFGPLARHLHRYGIHLAIATHSDAAEYNAWGRSEKDFIIGDELAHRVLKHAVPDIADKFFVVAHNPRVRGNRDPLMTSKKFHIRSIAQHYNLQTTSVLLFDDDPQNVLDNENGLLFKSIQVSARNGLDALEVWYALQLDASDFIKSNIDFDLGFLNPLTAPARTLQGISASVLLIAGQRELFYDDIRLFKTRLESTERTQTTEIIEADHVHAYPLLWQHPLRRITEIFLFLISRILMILLWSLTKLKTAKNNIYNSDTIYNQQVVDSYEADDVIRKVADFICRDQSNKQPSSQVK